MKLFLLIFNMPEECKPRIFATVADVKVERYKDLFHPRKFIASVWVHHNMAYFLKDQFPRDQFQCIVVCVDTLYNRCSQ